VIAPLGSGSLCLHFTHPEDLSAREADEVQRFVSALVDHLSEQTHASCQSRSRHACRRR
jgi:hypothetical protein